jgi:ribosomal protein S18 acetylase RimI-like enzyme
MHTSLTIQNHTPAHLDNLSAFIERYRSVYPDAKLISAGFYTYHPALENGNNVFCVFDDGGQIRAFAPVVPAPVGQDAAPSDPHHLWTILVADPTFENADQARELLITPVLEHARKLAAPFPASRPTRLASDMMVSQRADIAFLEQNGFARYDGMYVMRHPLPSPPPSENHGWGRGLALRHSKLATEAEQQQYLAAYNQGFPDNPKTLETLKFLLDTPFWAAGGSAIMAFHGEELIASILTYPTQDGKAAYTDDVFVLPAWRGRGIAKMLIAEGLHYAHAQGFAEVLLEVKQSNAPAIAVYRAMGYEIVNEEVFLGLFLNP